MNTHTFPGTSTFDSLTRTFGAGEPVGTYFAFQDRSDYKIVRADGTPVAVVHRDSAGFEVITGRLPKPVTRAITRKAMERVR